jgi:hypothetical protein
VSYLNPLRLHFAGKFGAAISTVNNDRSHFDNSTFLPEYQDRQTDGQPNGWFNPRGSADWRLFGCRVTSAWLSDGQPAEPADAVRAAAVTDSDRRVAAKLVDLDPDQQLVSTIWGLEVRLCTANGTTLLRGRMKTAAFMHIWAGARTGGDDLPLGAEYQSVLSDLEWGDIASSPMLQQLRGAALRGLLSIKFNVDGVSLNPESPDFLFGRIIGTIGPAHAGEPHHFVAGRQFMPTGGFVPDGAINSCVAVLDQSTRRLYVDFGNALPTVQAGGVLAPLGSLSVGVVMPPSPGQAATVLPIGDVLESTYAEADWYSTTAGVVALPPDKQLTDDEITAVANNPLTIRRVASDGTFTPGVDEHPSGVYVRADEFVFRADVGEVVEIPLIATRLGEPYTGARIVALLDPTQLQSDAPGVPASAVDFPARLLADSRGRGVLRVRTSNPGNPRGVVDGQVYGIRVAIEETLLPGANYPFNPLEFISLLVWDTPTISDPPTWFGGLQSIFQQYANLYPVMQRFLDLSNYEHICERRHLLMLSIGLPLTDPNSMPVTRDLSGAKRKAILRWLTDVGADGRPLRGVGPLVEAQEVGPRQPSPSDTERAMGGGKMSAASRRYGLRLNRGRR